MTLELNVPLLTKEIGDISAASKDLPQREVANLLFQPATVH